MTHSLFVCVRVRVHVHVRVHVCVHLRVHVLVCVCAFLVFSWLSFLLWICG